VKPNIKPISWGKLTLLVTGGGLLFASICAHVWINGSQEYRGLIASLDHVFDLALALGLSILLLITGRSLCGMFKLHFANTAEDLSCAFFLGTGTVGLSVLGLGLLGLLRPWPIATLMACYIVITARALPELFRTVTGAFHAATLTYETKIVTSAFLCLVAFLVVRTATPPHAYDELIYHLPVTQHFVQQGRVSAEFNNSLGNVPFLLHMVYAICLVAGSDIAAKLFSLFLAVFTALALYGFCRRFITRYAGVLAMFGFFAAGMVVEVAVTTRIDVSFAGMLFLASYSMMNYLETDERQWLWVSAVFAGFSLGIKHTAGLWLLFVGLMYLTERLVRKRERFGTVLKRGVAFMCVAMAIASPWYIKNYVWFHNPVYPFLTGEVADFGPQGIRYFNMDDERKLEAHFEVARKEIPEVVKSEEEELENAIRSRSSRHPMRLWEFFTQPNSYLMAEPFHFPNYLFLFIPCLLFLKRNKWILWLLGISLAFVFSVTWGSWIARYLLPAYPPLTIVASYSLTTLGERFEANRFAQRLPIYAVATALALVVAVSALSMREIHTFSFLAGSTSRREFPVPNAKPVHFINNKLPSTARIMMIGSQLNYGIDRDHLTDETWFSTKWRRLLVRNSSLDEVNKDLKLQGVTHIVYAPSLFTFAAKWGIKGTGGMDLLNKRPDLLSEDARRLDAAYPLLRNWATFTLYRMKFCERVYFDDDGYEILKIK